MRLSFIIQFKLLLPFTSCRKCLEKFLGVEVDMGCEHVNVLFGGGSWGIFKKICPLRTYEKSLKRQFPEEFISLKL